jgi:hypothetical protein
MGAPDHFTSPPESLRGPSRVLLDQVTVLTVLLRELEDGCPDALARARAFIRGQLAAMADSGEPRALAFIRTRQAEGDRPRLAPGVIRKPSAHGRAGYGVPLQIRDLDPT